MQGREMTMTAGEIERVVTEVARSYPPPLDGIELADVTRIAFHLSILSEHVPAGGHVVDIGGGIGLMSVGAAALGYRSTLVDDFDDAVNHEYPIESLGVHARYGVRVISADALRGLPRLEPGTLDAVTSFDSMEHWHCSPKATFHALLEALRPGGLFLLGVPNCVNLRKRLMVLFGAAKWSLMEHWYEPPVFRGHVREPDVDDLRYIARDLGLTNVKIFGRNWLGYHSRYGWVRALVPYADRLLRLLPTLCSDIYLAGQKPAP
jgi:SAM-dependent methyltransferase